jgi:hypothetical protein
VRLRFDWTKNVSERIHSPRITYTICKSCCANLYHVVLFVLRETTVMKNWLPNQIQLVVKKIKKNDSLWANVKIFKIFLLRLVEDSSYFRTLIGRFKLECVSATIELSIDSCILSKWKEWKKRIDRLLLQSMILFRSKN